MKSSKNKVKQSVDKNPIEQFLSGFDQILGSSDYSKEKQKNNQETVMFEGQEVSLADLQEKNPPAGGEEKEEKAYIEPGLEYVKEIIHAEERAISRQTQELDSQLREIMAEIKKLADSSKELQMQFKEVAVEQHVATPGKYHKTFFSWLLSIVRAARMKVEDSGAWLQAMHSKKKARGYNAMAKKHGTSFTLNNERTVATQVG